MGVFRQNGSSALAQGKKWGFFPGVSGSWLVSNENFLKDNNSISELKLRGGWGKTGNASGIPFYASYNLDRLNRDGGVWETAQWGTDIGWEVTTDTNFGVDLAFLNNKINCAINRIQHPNISLKDGVSNLIFFSHDIVIWIMCFNFIDHK